MKELLFQGAESRIYVETYLGKEMLVKERFQKNYRHPELDNHLTRERMKAECRNIVRCKQFGIKTPAIYYVDLPKRLIYLEYFKSSTTVKEYFEVLEKNGQLTSEKVKEVADMIGEVVAKMHMNNMVHGDLTTSNFLLVKNSQTGKNELIIIDFGLSHLEASDEDKGVDLYLLERALSSLNINTVQFFVDIIKNYEKMYKSSKIAQILIKFEEVRARGRKRSMVG
ncbi:hypothetical protein RUM43_002992 [Polyplax serrata]|uniref:non-specific serine/threonine protein kinase n=1 Tax=Polyplax serrata TaxID=468196 RepID=A0AAN8NVS3_POLSC